KLFGSGLGVLASSRFNPPARRRRPSLVARLAWRKERDDAMPADPSVSRPGPALPRLGRQAAVLFDVGAGEQACRRVGVAVTADLAELVYIARGDAGEQLVAPDLGADARGGDRHVV